MRIGSWAQFIKPALIGIIAVDLLALAAFSVRVDEVTRTVTIPAAQTVPGVAPTAPANPLEPPPAPAAPVAVNAEPGTSTATYQPESSPASTGEPSNGPASNPEPNPEPNLRAARCPIPITEPTSTGGLQSLIGFAPAFGPFKAEAFAAASAYQPALQLIGPILARYPEIAPTIEPAFTPYLQTFSSLLDSAYALVGPLYAPHRQAILEAEGSLAAALAPYAQRLVSSPLGGCVIELQTALLDDTSTARDND